MSVSEKVLHCLLQGSRKAEAVSSLRERYTKPRLVFCTGLPPYLCHSLRDVVDG
jgi:hypothetical protein